MILHPNGDRKGEHHPFHDTCVFVYINTHNSTLLDLFFFIVVHGKFNQHSFFFLLLFFNYFVISDDNENKEK